MSDNYSEFEVYYQPIVDILDGNKCIGAEALIRWNSNTMGFINPTEFIPLAEYLGLINPIGNHVMKQACLTCKYWNDNGHPDYKVNVNLSVVQLLQTDIVDIVKETIEATGINPKNLTLEVTESLAINDMERMKKILGALKELGCKLALDDFGTGYSSLNHIREIPFDVIKVDQSFVRDLAEDAYSQSFIKMVAELAETLGVNVCVEGIETERQFKALDNMKVKMVQGFFFDRPMTKDSFEGKYGQFGQMPANGWILADKTHWPETTTVEPVVHELQGPIDLQGYTVLVPSSQYHYYEDGKEAVFYLDDTKGEELLRCGIAGRLEAGAEGNDVLIFRNEGYMAVFTYVVDLRKASGSEVFRTGTAMLFKKAE
jgi:EAL domain-containing protein (putative c-di-GMP-specific phosphodiesterase class I)